MGCFSGRLMPAASDHKLFCKLCSPFCCSFDEFVEEKVISPSYSSAILTPPLSCSDLVCPLLTQAPYLCLPLLPPRWGGDASGVYLMASQTNVQFLTLKTLLASDATQSAIRITFQNASQPKSAGGNIHHLCVCA